MLVYGSYWTTHVSYPISVTTGGIVNVKLAAASSAAQQVYSSTSTPVYTRSATSATRTYVATPASVELTTKNIYSLATASFSGGYRIAGTAAATSTNITAGLYRVMAVGNWFYLRIGGTASGTTLTLPLAESTPETFYFEVTKINTISASTAGALYLTKVR